MRSIISKRDWAGSITAATIGLFILSVGPESLAVELKAMDERGKLTGAFAAVEGHVSLFSDRADESMLASTFGYSARGGYRWNNWGVSLLAEHNMWIATEYDKNVVEGAVNIAVGGEFIYARGLMRTAVYLGPSILAYDTPLDDAGSVGFYANIRPAGFRWPVQKMLVLGFDPLNFNMVAPVLSGIPLVYIQYRTNLYLEVVF